ncbi:MAG: spore cortex biosynthesis protein YabQ [Candidatus Fimisoma sp.]
MTDLIKEQIRIFLVMCCCGMTSAMVWEVFRLFRRRLRIHGNTAKIITEIICCIVIAFLIGDFCFYCRNGKLSFMIGASFATGLWLWKKFFYGIISAGDQHEQKGEKAQGIRDEKP